MGFISSLRSLMLMRVIWRWVVWDSLEMSGQSRLWYEFSVRQVFNYQDCWDLVFLEFWLFFRFVFFIYQYWVQNWNDSFLGCWF